jgi:hypothetical protein
VAGEGFRRRPAAVAAAAWGRAAGRCNAAIKRLGEVCECLRVLPEQLAGGEREWKRELGAAAAMAAEGARVARGGGQGGLK